MLEIKGIIPPVITPMKEDETISEQELRRQVRRLIDAGVHGLFAAGTNGEGYILSPEEKEEVFAIVIAETGGRVPVYAGTGAVSTREAVRLSKKAEELGADALSVITPWFAKTSEDELYHYYKAIAENVHLPLVLYNIPVRTGNDISVSLVQKLSEIDNIMGIKDSSGDFDNMLQYIEKIHKQGFSVLSGNDSLILKNLTAGGKGAISGCANVYPENMVAIYERFVKGDLDGARQAQEAICSFRECFRYGNPNTIVKLAVELLGYPVGKCRAPFNRISQEGICKIKAIMEENKRLGIK